ncbi:hypothetical protein [Tateyamaria sp.]|uniref:hypothetical protein n=1 Tax=Tateyamaria sp. TaxID=1929288 RepID=UPI00329FBF5F
MIVLAPTETCGPGALAVRDLPEGSRPQLPATWLGFPIFLDSPVIFVTVAFDHAVQLDELSYDGATSALKVNANIQAPLLCVVDVFDVASIDLTLPGKLN